MKGRTVTTLTSAGTLWRMAPDSIDATIQVDKKPDASGSALSDCSSTWTFETSIEALIGCDWGKAAEHKNAIDSEPPRRLEQPFWLLNYS